MFRKNKKDNKGVFGNTSSIIKRNWKKLSVIIAILVCLLAGLAVGLYFVLRPSKVDLRSDVLNNNIITSKQAKENLLKPSEKDKNKAIGLFFYKKNSEITNFLTWGDSQGKKAKNNIFDKKIGPLSAWATKSYSESNKINWYAINIQKNSNIVSDLFLTKTGSNIYSINTNLIKNPSGAGSDLKTINDFGYSKGAKGNDDYNDPTKNYKTRAKAELQSGKKGNKASEWNLNLSKDGKDYKALNINEGTTLMFNKEHNLTQIMNFKSVSTDSKEKEQLSEYYRLFFDEVQNAVNND